jgi:hypothetical protein
MTCEDVSRVDMRVPVWISQIRVSLSDTDAQNLESGENVTVLMLQSEWPRKVCKQRHVAASQTLVVPQTSFRCAGRTDMIAIIRNRDSSVPRESENLRNAN